MLMLMLKLLKLAKRWWSGMYTIIKQENCRLVLVLVRCGAVLCCAVNSSSKGTECRGTISRCTHLSVVAGIGFVKHLCMMDVSLRVNGE